MDPAATLETLTALEHASVGALILHGLLLHEKLPHHARLALAIHEEAAVAAEALGGVLGVDMRVK